MGPSQNHSQSHNVCQLWDVSSNGLSQSQEKMWPCGPNVEVGPAHVAPSVVMRTRQALDLRSKYKFQVSFFFLYILASHANRKRCGQLSHIFFCCLNEPS